MTLSGAPHIFDAIEILAVRHTERFPAPSLLIDPPHERSRTLLLPEARKAAQDPDTDPELRDAVWRRLVQLAQRDRAGAGAGTGAPAGRGAHAGCGMWSIVTLWMLLPGLRRAVFRIARCSRVDRQDICSAVLTAALEALYAADPERPGLGDELRRAASSGGWRFAKAAAREQPVADLEITHRQRPARIHDSAQQDKVVHRGVVGSRGPSGPASARQEGERLGAVAQRMGLDAALRAARLRTTSRAAGGLPHQASVDGKGRTSRRSAS
ncbi:hypothetical protein Sm713_16060 [Streptomyces sp. TS71-3]|nr:hypothetical protein Sm713_16060 [Streptomyces sp. TS71-3]